VELAPLLFYFLFSKLLFSIIFLRRGFEFLISINSTGEGGMESEEEIRKNKKVVSGVDNYMSEEIIDCLIKKMGLAAEDPDFLSLKEEVSGEDPNYDHLLRFLADKEFQGKKTVIARVENHKNFRRFMLKPLQTSGQLNK
jgi:hypothetical protein